MKTNFSLLTSFTGVILLITSLKFAYSQNVGINTDGSAPDASAQLDVKASNRGILIPRVALTGTNDNLTITSCCANGLLVFNTASAGTPPNNVTPGFYYWDGTKWVRLETNNPSDWSLTGNAGTSPSTNFIGTSDLTDLSIRTNSTERIRVQSDGTIRLNNYTTDNILKTSLGNGTIIVGSVNLASSEVSGILPIANGGTNSNAVPTSGGIAYGTGTAYAFSSAGAVGQVLISNGSSAPSWGSPNNLFWLLSGNSGTNPNINFIGTVDPQDLVIRTNNLERIRVTNSGDVGIGVTIPTHRLHVNGAVRGENGFLANDGTASVPSYRFTSDLDVGMFRPSANQIGFALDGVEKIRINGNATDALLGINNSNPSAPLDIIRTTSNSMITATNYGNAPNYDFRRANGSPSTPTILGSGGVISRLRGLGYDGSSFQTAAQISFETDAATSAGDMPGRIVFSTTPDGSSTLVDRMTINNAGIIRFHNYTANGVLVTSTSNGTIQEVAPGPAGNVLLSNGSVWTSASGSGNFIQNQNSADQTANFRISGIGRANTSFQAPVYTRADAGTVSIRPNSNSTSAIQLQNAAGISILNVDATNSRIGIGTVAPQTLLQLLGAHSTTQFRMTLPAANNGGGTGDVHLHEWVSEPCVTWEGAGIGVNVDNTYTGAGCTGGVPMPKLNSSLGQAFIRFETNGGNMRFYTLSNTALVNTLPERERLTILNNGNVGIGITNPPARLSVAGDGTGTAYIGGGFCSGNYTGISLNGQIGSCGVYNILSSPTDQNLYINRPSGNNIFFRENNNSQVTIAAGGNMGIGYTTPYAPLTIAHEASYTFPNPGSSSVGGLNIRMTTSGRQTGITFSQANVNNAQAGIYVHQDNSNGTHMYFATTNDYSIGPRTRMTILNNGNVGIGTITPSHVLHVIESGNSGSISGIHVQESNDGQALTINESGNGTGIIVDASGFGGGIVSTCTGVVTDNVVGHQFYDARTTTTAGLDKIAVDIQSTNSWTGANNALNILASNATTNIGINVNVGGGTNNYAGLFNGGFVGVGTTTPSNVLHVNDNSNSPSISGIFVNETNAGQAMTITEQGNGTGIYMESYDLGGGIVSLNYGSMTTGVIGHTFADYRTSSTDNVNKVAVEALATGIWSGTSSVSNALFANATGGFTNIGVRASASGGTNNYAAIFSPGRVGIGTTTPAYPLDVTDFVNITGTATYGVLSQTGATSNTGPYNINIGISASNGIRTGTAFYAFSDKRIKKDVRTINPSDALEIVKKLNPVSYRYVDTLYRERREILGFIAQEVEEIVPQAVGVTPEFLPNIMKEVSVVKSDEGLYIANVQAGESVLKEGDEVKCFKANGEVLHITISKQLKESQFEIIPPYPLDCDKLFFYGSKVDDFRNLDHNKIFTIGIAAIKALVQRVNDLENENKLLKSEILSIHSTLNDLKKMIAEFNSDALEKGLANNK